MTNDLGSQVILFIHFKKLDSPFGFLQLFKAEKHGMDVPKYKFDLQKNSLLHKWTQVRNIITVMNLHEASTQDLLSKLIKECKQVTDLADAPNFQFLQEQLQLMLSSPQGRRYSKHVLIFAAELICVSPRIRLK